MDINPHEVKISVVIPAYNAAHFLPRSLKSVYAQTLVPHEVIVVDNGSTDGSGKVASSFGAHVIRLEKPGLAAARNVGIRQATGEWIALLDADDWWAPEKLARQVSAIQPNAVLVYTGIRLCDDTGMRSERKGASPDVARDMLRYSNPIAPSTVLMLREAVLAAGGFIEGSPGCEDWAMWVQLMPFGSFAAVSDTLTNYYLHSQSLSASPERMLEGLKTILDPVLLAGYRGLERWMWRRRIWAQQLCSAGQIAKDNNVKGELGYFARSLTAWPSPFWQPRRFACFATSAQSALLRSLGGTHRQVAEEREDLVSATSQGTRPGGAQKNG